MIVRNALGPRKVQRLAQKTGLPVVSALTRGGTDHRIDMRLADGRRISLFKDGTLMTDDGHQLLPPADRTE